MKKIILSIFVIFSFSVKSQTKAMTEDGKEVVLFENKTWKYTNESDEKSLETIVTNDRSFEKSKDATFLIRSKKIDAGLYYNPKSWKITKANLSLPSLEHLFINTSNSSLFALLVSENAPVQTLKNLKDLVLSGVQRSADYFRLQESEYRTVNGIKVLYLKYTANAKGLDFQYVGNYYLTNDGYCSITAYTFGNKYEENKNELESFIDGMVKTEKAKEMIEMPPPPMSSKKIK